MQANSTVVFDACILYSAPLTDLLMNLGARDLFWGRWTENIHEEWTRNLGANRPDLDPAKLSRRRTLMNTHMPGSMVTGYESLIESLTLPDPGDRHVLAAAIHCRADVIVTKNLRDFPASVLGDYRVTAQHPDDFLSDLLRVKEEQFCASVRSTQARLGNPPVTWENYFLMLEAQELIHTVLRLRQLIMG